MPHSSEVRLIEKSRRPLLISPIASLPRCSGVSAVGCAAYQSRRRSSKRERRKNQFSSSKYWTGRWWIGQQSATPSIVTSSSSA